MTLYISYDDTTITGTLKASTTIPNFVWNRIVDLALAIEPDIQLFQASAVVDWATLLSISPQLIELRNRYNFRIECDPQAAELIRRHANDYKLVRQASDTLRQDIPIDQLGTHLKKLGFTRRELTDAQLRDTAHLVALAHGANFSVPGAGKTTVAFATHLLTQGEDTFLLVIAPKNAFGAWDEVIIDTLDPTHPYADVTPFTRLNSVNINSVFEAPSRRMIISYDQLLRSVDVLRPFLHSHKVHVILDESHRMKSGDRSQRGSVLLSIAHLPIRRDILSGTPIPRSIDDIAPQIDFLWPGQGLGRRVVNTSSPKDELRGLFVRTTKRELDLPPRQMQYIAVEMSLPQLAFYSLLRDEVLKHLARIRTNSRINWQSARRSVIRLLQVSSNPTLAVQSMTDDHPQDFPYDDPKTQTIFQAIVAEQASPKILEACRIARMFAESGQKTVIWTSFTDNVTQIAHMLHDLGATFIHGKVDTGSDMDDLTREGRIRRFHEDKNCFVLVANPAACSEGISLHQVCHCAIYVDRTYNAAHFLQSIDRIHRLGLDKDVVTQVFILESIAPQRIGAIDYSVRRRLVQKLHTMSEALDDDDLRQLALDEEEGEVPIDYDMDLEDLNDIIEELMGRAPMPPEEDIV